MFIGIIMMTILFNLNLIYNNSYAIIINVLYF